MVNQIAIAGLVQGLSEAIAFGQRAGLDMNEVLGVIGKGAAQSWQMDNRGKTMIEGKFDFGFAVDWMRKDLGLVLDEAKRNGARLPVTALVDQFYADVQQAGRQALGHVEPDHPAQVASRPQRTGVVVAPPPARSDGSGGSGLHRRQRDIRARSRCRAGSACVAAGAAGCCCCWLWMFASPAR